MVRFEEDLVKDIDKSKMVFSGAHTHIEENVEDPKVIWDSVSTIENIQKCKVTMCLNGGSRAMEE